jgi:hypothetical protein
MTPILGIMASQISGHLETGAYESISTVTVGGGGSATITFSHIPALIRIYKLDGITKSHSAS